MRIYLIAPAPDFGRSQLNEDCDIGVGERVAMMANAAIATVAALFPAHYDIRLCDEIIDPVDEDDPADLVAITANVAQAPRALAIAERFRAKGRTVVIGGPHVSLAPEAFEDHADCIVVGEFEPIAAAFVADLEAGRLKPRYDSTKADLAHSPMPRWDLYPNERALAGVVQTSRGCPFECNFCDVIQYLGRVQRHKPIPQVMAELQVLYDAGYRQVHLSDDNFTVYRRRTHALLAEIAAWNGADGREPMNFLSQVSIDLARDETALSLCYQAGFRYALVGLETDSTAALQESLKRQNMRVDLVRETETLVRAGLAVSAGLIVGFDSDDTSCFERQLSFAMALPVINFNISVLSAPVSTPLFAKMKDEGRIIGDPSVVDRVGSGTSVSNIAPLRMTSAELTEGTEWLRRAVLDPDGVIRRFEHLASLLADVPAHLSGSLGARASRRKRPLHQLIGQLARDPGARRVIDCANTLGHERPGIRADLMQALGLYLNKYVRLGSTNAPPPHAARKAPALA